VFQPETGQATVRVLTIGVFVLALIMGFQNCSPTHSSKTKNSDSSLSTIDSVEKFSQTLHPILKQNCGPCHGVSQVPMFAVGDAQLALNTIKEFHLVDLNSPSQSLFVQQIRGGHNGFPASLADSIQQAIEKWATGSTLPQPVDLEAPDVSITSPSSRQTIAGTYNIQVAASDNVGVSKVTLKVDGITKSQDMAAPYTFSLNTLNLSDGSHELRAWAQDAAGNEGSSTLVNVTVDNSSPQDTTPPTVSFTAPANNAGVSGNVTLTVQATDNVAVSGVTFYLDGGTQIGSEDKTAPYSVAWNSASVVDGPHKIQAWVSDTSFNVTVSTDLVLNVSGGKVINNPNAKFSWILSNVLQPKCTRCHGASKASAGLRLHTYANVFAHVSPPNPDVSQLYNAVGPGGYMPPGGDSLTATQVQAISDWIQLGAPNN
jgi:mono/diheme cytochrome c family protein